MNIKNLLISAIIFASTITCFNTKTQNPEPLFVITGALLIFAAGAAIGTAIDRATPSTIEKNLKQLLAKKEAIIEKHDITIKDLRDKTSEIEDFEVIGKDGIVKMRQSFGDTLDSLNEHAQRNPLILTDNKGRNHVLCPGANGDKYALFQNTRDFHKCDDLMAAFNELSNKVPTT